MCQRTSIVVCRKILFLVKHFLLFRGPPTVLGSFAAAINELPDLVDPVDAYLWKETFSNHARQADEALADFRRELDTRIGPADALQASRADLKESCATLHTTVAANSTNLAALIMLMSQSHARVSNLEAATAKNATDVAATMAALVETATAHATTAETVAGFHNAVDDHVGRHIGSLTFVVSGLGQDVLTLRTLITNIHAWETPSTRCTVASWSNGARWYRRGCFYGHTFAAYGRR